jgi:hypothetical protein
MARIEISESVGRGGRNLPGDVVTIGGALVAVGPQRGGLFAPPLTVQGLGEAIKHFQAVQTLPARDGRVDRGGGTLRRLNELLNGGLQPPAPPSPPGTGLVTPLALDLPGRVSSAAYTPNPVSFRNDLAFRWDSTSGSGTIRYFALNEDVVPNWFGVVVPEGLGTFEHVHLFFHPTPAQAGYKDATYKTKEGWTGLFHYMTDLMSAQFCAAQSGQVLIMPLLTQSAASTCGILPARWEPLFAQILSQLGGGPKSVSSLVVSSFSAGITYSAAFRRSANLGGKLRGIIDFDGLYSSYRSYSSQLPHTALRFWQTPVAAGGVSGAAAANLFPLPAARWSSPFDLARPEGAGGARHGYIPHTMMHFAATQTRVR